jgi:hypothetical protein
MKSISGIQHPALRIQNPTSRIHPKTTPSLVNYPAPKYFPASGDPSWEEGKFSGLKKFP